MRPSVTAGTSPFRMCRSVPQIVTASTRTMASVSACSVGFGTSSHALFPGPWYTSARMATSLSGHIDSRTRPYGGPDRPTRGEGPGEVRANPAVRSVQDRFRRHVDAEQIARRHDAHEPAAVLDENMADPLLHHLFGHLGHRCIHRAPDQLG